MMGVSVVPAQAVVSETSAKHSGRGLNKVPPEVAAAIKEAQKTVVKGFEFATPVPADD